MAQYEKGKLYQIPIIDFKQDPDQPRKVIDPEGLEELTASIRKHGFLQPLLFRVEIAGHDPESRDMTQFRQKLGSCPKILFQDSAKAKLFGRRQLLKHIRHSTYA